MKTLETDFQNLLVLSDLYRLVSLGLEKMDVQNQTYFFELLEDFLSIPFENYNFYKKGNYNKEIEFSRKLLFYKNQNLEYEYNRLFNTQAGVPFSEGSYVSIEKGNLIGEIMGFYKAVNFPFKTEKQGSPDSIKVELGFISFLFLKEFNLSLEKEMSKEEKKEKLDIIRELRDKFYFEHLIPWIPEFISIVVDSTKESFYYDLMIILQSLVENYSNVQKNLV